MSEQIDPETRAVLSVANGAMKRGDWDRVTQLLTPLGPPAKAPLLASFMVTRAFHAQGDLFAAHGHIEAAMATRRAPLSPLEREMALLEARLARELLEYEKAVSAAKRVLDEDAGHVGALEVWSRSQRALGRQGDVADRLDEALQKQSGEPRLILARLALPDPSQRIVDKANELAGSAVVPADLRVELDLALARLALEGGDGETCWRHAQRAQQSRRVDQSALQRLRDEREASFAAFAAMEPLAADTGPKRLFLVGAPRTGSSLFQSILAAMPEWHSVGERGALLPFVLGKSTIPDAANLRDADNRGLRKSAGEVDGVIDKTPANIQAIGQLARLFPQAQFVCPFRNSADTLVSIWLRTFPQAYSYANHIDTIVDFLEHQVETVEQWIEKGVNLRAVSYEQLVNAPEATMHSLCDELGCAFEPEMLSHANRKQPVGTFSAEKVRGPVTTAYVNSSAALAKHLEPYVERLQRIQERQDALCSRSG